MRHIFNLNSPGFNEELEFEPFITEIKNSPSSGNKLVALLREQHWIYNGQSTNSVIRMRGFIMASFCIGDLPDDALVYIFDELENSREPFLVAAAALALRQAKYKRSEMAGLLLMAFNNIKFVDSSLTFESYAPQWPVKNSTTAIKEILKTLSWLGAYAKCSLSELTAIHKNADGRLSSRVLSDLEQAIQLIEADTNLVENCCLDLNHGTHHLIANRVSNIKEIENILLQDQEANEILFKDLFKKKYTLISFFYTRCDNPLKCSLTITNMANIQSSVKMEGLSDKLNLAAITYDSQYDLPHRLKIYGGARGIKFDDDTKFFRVVNDFTKLKEHFDLSVNYIETVINRHAIELYLLDPDGKIIMSFHRSKINNNYIIEQVKNAINDQQSFGGKWRNKIKIMSRDAYSIILSAFVFFFPKCPLCFAAYFSVLGIAGFQIMPYIKYMFPLLVLAILVNLFTMFRAAKRRNGYVPFYFSLLGTFFIVLFGHIYIFNAGAFIGLVCLVCGTLINSLTFIHYRKMKFWVKHFFIKLSAGLDGEKRILKVDGNCIEVVKTID